MKKFKNKLTNAIDGANSKNTDWGWVVPGKFGKPTNFEYYTLTDKKKKQREVK